jgi:GNAT superfamily N-acetyltransferase
LPQTLLFESPNFSVRELISAEIPLLQALFEANPAYFLIVGGQPPRPDEAQQEFDERVPEHLSFSTRWFAGAFDRSATLRGLIILVSDLAAPGVWHIALFFLDGALRGTGAAMELHTALEAFARESGAHWLRLAVVDGTYQPSASGPSAGTSRFVPARSQISAVKIGSHAFWSKRWQQGRSSST